MPGPVWRLFRLAFLAPGPHHVAMPTPAEVDAAYRVLTTEGRRSPIPRETVLELLQAAERVRLDTARPPAPPPPAA